MQRVVTTILCLWVLTLGAFSQVNIWEGTACGKKVVLTPYPVSGAGSHIAIVVCPGGSYFWHDSETEGHGVARWLQQHGIAAFDWLQLMRFAGAAI